MSIITICIITIMFITISITTITIIMIIIAIIIIILIISFNIRRGRHEAHPRGLQSLGPRATGRQQSEETHILYPICVCWIYNEDLQQTYQRLCC